MKKTLGLVAAELYVMYSYDPGIKQRVDHAEYPIQELVEVGLEHDVHSIEDGFQKIRLEQAIRAIFSVTEACNGL